MVLVVHRVVIMLVVMVLQGVKAVGAESALENFAPVFLRQPVEFGHVRVARDCRWPAGEHLGQRWQRNLMATLQAHAAAMRLEVLAFSTFPPKALRRGN